MSDFQKLQQLIDKADEMIKTDITKDDAEFVAWEMSVKRLLNKQFGKDSIEMRTFLDISFYSTSWFDATDAEKHRRAIRSCHDGLQRAKAVLESFLDDFDCTHSGDLVKPSDCTKVFIVHGHDGELKESVARIIEKQGIEAVILSEQANQGKTIIEKFENYSDVGGAVCLFTADDIAKAKNGTTEKYRARQNVVFETGYFIGKLGRDHIVILADHGVEMPSDLSGVVHTDTTNWQIDLLKELKAMGYTIDFNKLF